MLLKIELDCIVNVPRTATPKSKTDSLRTKGPITYSFSSSQRVHDYHLQRETNISQCYVQFHISFKLARSPKPTAFELHSLPSLAWTWQSVRPLVDCIIPHLLVTDWAYILIDPHPLHSHLCFLNHHRILVPEYGFMHLELIPMLVGFFTYKIATFFLAIEEALRVEP